MDYLWELKVRTYSLPSRQSTVLDARELKWMKKTVSVFIELPFSFMYKAVWFDTGGDDLTGMVGQDYRVVMTFELDLGGWEEIH